MRDSAVLKKMRTDEYWIEKTKALQLATHLEQWEWWIAVELWRRKHQLPSLSPTDLFQESQHKLWERRK